MNLTEKLTATYLRLNGFLLLQQFTVFSEEQHTHIDLIGYRPANSFEKVGAYTLPVDERLFEALSVVLGRPAKAEPLRIICQVKSNELLSKWGATFADYAGNFLGGRPLRVDVRKSSASVNRFEHGIELGLQYVHDWIHHRIDQMNENAIPKDASWTWSEDFLGDFLVHRSFQ